MGRSVITQSCRSAHLVVVVVLTAWMKVESAA